MQFPRFELVQREVGQKQLGCFSCCLSECQGPNGNREDERHFEKKWWVVGKLIVWGDSEVGSNCMWLCPQFLPESGLYHLWFWGSNQPASLTACASKHELGRLPGWKLFKAHTGSHLSKAAGPSLLFIDLSFLWVLEQPLEGQRGRNLSKVCRKWHVRTEV